MTTKTSKCKVEFEDAAAKATFEFRRRLYFLALKSARKGACPVCMLKFLLDVENDLKQLPLCKDENELKLHDIIPLIIPDDYLNPAKNRKEIN